MPVISCIFSKRRHYQHSKYLCSHIYSHNSYSKIQIPAYNFPFFVPGHERILEIEFATFPLRLNFILLPCVTLYIMHIHTALRQFGRFLVSFCGMQLHCLTTVIHWPQLLSTADLLSTDCFCSLLQSVTHTRSEQQRKEAAHATSCLPLYLNISFYST